MGTNMSPKKYGRDHLSCIPTNIYIDPNNNNDSAYIKDFYEDTTIFVTGIISLHLMMYKILNLN